MRISDWSSDVCSSDLPDQLRHAIRAAGVALWSWNVDTDAFAMDELGFELWDLPSSNQVTFGELSARIHPADRDRVQSAFSATRAIRGPYATDFRFIVGDTVRWEFGKELVKESGLQ